MLSTHRGIQAVKWSLVVLSATAALQAVVVLFSGSVALLADTIHNIADAATAVPLWFAFWIGRRKPSKRFTYGFGRFEDLAGVLIVEVILFSAIMAGHEAVDRFIHPRPVRYLGAVVLASIIGFIGNEGVARLRIRVGKEINSAALIADGHHARVDALTSLGVLLGAGGIWFGYPMADPLVGILITAAILRIVWSTGRTVFKRLLDGVDPEIIREIERIAADGRGICGITDIRARWLGHRLIAELNLAVEKEMSVSEGHRIAVETIAQIRREMPFLSKVLVHIDPKDASVEDFHD